MTEAVRHGDAMAQNPDLATLYGVRYPGSQGTAELETRTTNLYYYRAFIGPHEIAVETGDCVYYLADDARSAVLRRGPTRVASRHLATVIRGYLPEDKSTTLQQV